MIILGWRRWGWKVELVCTLAIAGTIHACSENRTLAQITPDKTLGTESSVVVPSNFPNVEIIERGAVRGANLFHSFKEFNVGEGRGAYFFSPNAEIQNILTRVTGGNPSKILGTLGTFGESNPNLFLMNPNGIIFGPNASLDVGGSFMATTANAIQLGSPGQFSASAPTASRLVTVNPSALLFNQIAAQPINSIESRASLSVPNSRSLSFLGGDVSLNGGALFAPGGRVELGGVAGSGTVGLNSDSRLSFPKGVTRANVSLVDGSEVNVRAEGGGSIGINSGHLDILEESKVRAGILSGMGSVDSQAGDVEIKATGAITLANNSLISNAVTTDSTGNAGDIKLTAESLSLTDGAQVSASTFGQGNAGNISISANNISSGGVNKNTGLASGVLSNVEAGAEGNGGNISITGESFSLIDGARLNTSTAGKGGAGDISLETSNAVTLDGTNTVLASATLGQRDAGSLMIDTQSLMIRNGAQVFTDTLGNSNAGDLTVTASQGVQVIGDSANEGPASLLGARTYGQGRGGNLTIETPQLIVQDGGVVSASARPKSQGKGGNLTIIVPRSVEVTGTTPDGQSASALVARAEGTGNAGKLIITTGRLLISNGGAVSTKTFSSGEGGNIDVTASEFVKVSGSAASNLFSSSLSTETAGGGNAGDLKLTTGRLLIENGGFVAATARSGSSGDAGNLIINAAEAIEVIARKADGKFPSGLTTLVEPDAEGEGGDLALETQKLSIKDGAVVTVGNLGSGDAGTLRVNANIIQLDNQGALSAETTSGKGGNIELKQAQDLRLRRNSQISAEAIGTATGGNINIDSDLLVALEDSDITANAFGGPGGRVQINTRGLLRSLNSDITASSALGAEFAGLVEINTPDTQLQGSLTQLSTNFISPEQVVSGSCLARRNVERGSFTVTGTGGFPRSPYEAISGRYNVTEVQPIQGNGEDSSVNAGVNKVPWKIGDPIQEAQGMVVTADGRTIVGTNSQLATIAKAQKLICHAN